MQVTCPQWLSNHRWVYYIHKRIASMQLLRRGVTENTDQTTGMKKRRCCLVLLLIVLVLRQYGVLVGVQAETGFVSARGMQLMLSGTPFYANGFNAYWLMFLASDPSQRDKVSSAFQEASSHDLNIARAWAFSDGGDWPLQYSPGSYNEQMFQGLDFVISVAGENGVKLVLSLVNNYENFGGKKQYVEWARNQGQSISSEDDFFTNPLVKGYYKNHIKTVLNRRNTLTGFAYKDDATIMAWELMNEIRCPSDQSGQIVQAWITEMASFLKSIDGNHMLEAGLEGFYGQTKMQYNPQFQVGTDFIANNQIPDVDFATVHSYPDQWLYGSSYESQVSFLKSWLQHHIQDAQLTLKKPVLFAEFGLSLRNFSSNQRDEVYDTVYGAIYSSASSGGAAVGGLYWQFLTEGMDNFRDGYEVILSESPSTASLIYRESQKLGRIRKMYARLRDILRLKESKDR